jgi:hypothetical protein
MRTTGLMVILPALAIGAARTEAQEWRTLDVSRQLHDTSALQVRITYGAGRMALHPAATPVLYQMQMRYDAERTEPLYDYQLAAHTLRVGIQKHTTTYHGDEKGGDMQLALAKTVPLDMSMELGAVQADIDLSGLTVERLKMDIGASETTIRFDTLNRTRMRALDLNIGAASVRAVRMGNANVRDITAKIGVGSLDLDLGGDWTGEMDLTTEVALGSVTVHVPRDVGVRLEVEKFLASIDTEGMTKRGDTYYSDNWDSAKRRVRIRAHATLGGFELDRSLR